MSMGKKISKGGQRQFSWGDTVFKGTGEKKRYCCGRRMLEDRNDKKVDQCYIRKVNKMLFRWEENVAS